MSIKTTTASPATEEAPAASGGATRLDLLRIGDEAVLGPPDRSTPTVLRLLEMGLISGAVVRVTRRAPLGDPLEVMVKDGARLCLRREDARAFSVSAPPAGGRSS